MARRFATVFVNGLVSSLLTRGVTQSPALTRTQLAAGSVDAANESNLANTRASMRCPLCRERSTGTEIQNSDGLAA
jgi:hypothetical protein